MPPARDGTGLSFALPPSLGLDPVKELARRFADVLYGAGFSTVVPMKTYEQLELALLAGEVDAAWGPPIVCARVESAGGQVALRAVRYGAVTYRAVLICRTSDALDLRLLGVPEGRVVRAAWVDPRSMAGYILPRHHLRSRGIDLDRAFLEERLLGSYEACFRAVLRGESDITASFANRRGLGYVELCRDRAFDLRTLGYTDECPNDAVVVSPRLEPDEVASLLAGFHRLIAHPSSLSVLTSTFQVDGFDRPPASSYSPLLSLL
ncbi:MAG TPA: PhnD/SsuA/transferrin family substrate-binding protein [Kofleriaceae bacterium]|nr:PhnD/SsuA/transferrin family substrate-binding protein [Kofleriaceae bacterium]